MTAAALLRAHPLFAGLEEQFVTRIAEMAEALTPPAGTRVFAQNDPGDALYLVADGVVSVMARAPGDRLVELERSGPGAVIGEFCLLDGGRRSAEAHVPEGALLYRIDLHRLNALLMTCEPAASQILTRLRLEIARRTRVTMSEIVACPTGETEARLPVMADHVPNGASIPDAKALLERFPGFDAMRPGDWDRFSGALHPRNVARGTRLGAPHEVRDALLIVGRGALRTALPVRGGLRQVLIHGPGALANAAAFCDALPCPAVVEAREATILFELPRRAFEDLHGTAAGAAVTAILGARMTQDLRQLSREVARLGCGPCRAGSG